MSSHRVVFLVFDDVLSLDVSGPAEVFTEATIAGADYELVYVSPSGSAIRTSIGTRISVDGAARDVSAADTVVIPGADRLPVSPIEPELIEAARHLAGLHARVVTICTGAFTLAATGMLAGHRVTTHWEHASLLARAYPEISVEPDALFVEDGPVHTSAGVTTGIDLALALVEQDHDAALARIVAQRLVVHLRRAGGQSQFSVALRMPEPRTSPVRRVVQAVLADPTEQHTVTSLARLAGVSPRHLTRLMSDELAITPSRLVESARLERAITILLEGATVAETAVAAGFGSTENLRRIFVSHLGMPPTAYRDRFASSSVAPLARAS